MSWGLLNLITLALYMGFMIWLGIWSERGQKESANGFLLADRNVTLPWIVMSVLYWFSYQFSFHTPPM